MNTPNSSDHFTTDRFSERAHEPVDQIAETVGDAEERIRHGVEDTADCVRYAVIADFYSHSGRRAPAD